MEDPDTARTDKGFATIRNGCPVSISRRRYQYKRPYCGQGFNYEVFSLLF